MVIFTCRGQTSGSTSKTFLSILAQAERRAASADLGVAGGDTDASPAPSPREAASVDASSPRASNATRSVRRF